MGFLMMRAELDGLVCSGPRHGAHPTRTPSSTSARPTPPGRSRARRPWRRLFVRRYLTSHGPATLRDFTWWSGLTLTDARRGAEAAGDALLREEIDGQTYWSDSGAPPPAAGARTHLLHTYDEYISYRDRSAIHDPARGALFTFDHLLVVDGRIVGTWKRTLAKGGVTVTTSPFAPGPMPSGGPSRRPPSGTGPSSACPWRRWPDARRRRARWRRAARRRELRRPAPRRAMPVIRRPAPDEYAPYYHTYVSLVPGDDLLPTLAAQTEEALAALRGVTEARGGPPLRARGSGA